MSRITRHSPKGRNNSDLLWDDITVAVNTLIVLLLRVGRVTEGLQGPDVPVPRPYFATTTRCLIWLDSNECYKGGLGVPVTPRSSGHPVVSGEGSGPTRRFFYLSVESDTKQKFTLVFFTFFFFFFLWDLTLDPALDPRWWMILTGFCSIK